MRNTKMDLIVRLVADYFDISENDLTGERRFREFSIPRQITMHLIYYHVIPSKSSISRYLGIDRASIYHGLNVVKDNPEIESHIKRIELILNKEFKLHLASKVKLIKKQYVLIR
ncbi:helix-turn-helix domain-containing protein [Ekhidna sp.]